MNAFKIILICSFESLSVELTDIAVARAEPVTAKVRQTRQTRFALFIMRNRSSGTEIYLFSNVVRKDRLKSYNNFCIIQSRCSVESHSAHYYGHRWDQNKCPCYRVSSSSGLILRNIYGVGPRKLTVNRDVRVKQVSVKRGSTVYRVKK